MTLNPLYVFIGAVAIVLGTVAGVVYCASTGNKDQIPTILGITSPIVLGLLGAIGLGSHQKNVANQEKIADKADASIVQNDVIIAKVDAVKQLATDAAKK